ncbi:MAG: fructosamine kinase family protein [Actinomycetia bacterium]|nr:fructosamine kinase family protein [Actinomycetes bacterium]
MARERFEKRLPPGSAREARWEAAGLRWLAAAEGEGGARTVRVLSDDSVTPTAQSKDSAEVLVLERLQTATPTTAQIEEFGAALGRTHAAGAPAFGAGPPGWDGGGYLGPASELLPLPLEHYETWGQCYGEARVRHTLRMARDRGIYAETTTFDRVIERLSAGEFDDDSPPARLHGDLWSGNLIWTPEGGTLIDPAAHGGHPLTDLAMLLLFGGEREDRVVQAYVRSHPLREDWRDLIGLHQLHPVLLHAVLFGGGYIAQAKRLAGRYA